MIEARSTNRCAAIKQRTSCEGQGEKAGLLRKGPERRVLADKDDPTVYKIYRDIEIFGGKGCLVDLSGDQFDSLQFGRANVRHPSNIVRVLN